RRGEGAARDDADLLTAGRDDRPLAGDALALQLQADTPPQAFVLLAASQRVTADELALIQLYRPAEARLKRVGVFIQFVPIQGHGGFEAQRITSTEAARLDPTGDQFLPQYGPLVLTDHEFQTILAGVAGPADDARLPAVACRRGVVVSQLPGVRLGQ